MARSLLPSRWRAAGQAKAKARRASRRQVAQVMAALVEDPSAWDDEVGAYETSDRQVRTVVSWRRSADKVNPFIRWATATTAALPKESRLQHLRGVLPKGVIGAHALTHLARVEAFDRSPRRRWTRWVVLLDRGQVAAVLRRVLEERGGHAWVNEVVARCAVVDSRGEPVTRERVRVLRGVHDVLGFIEEVPRWERYVVDAVCRVLWEVGFDVERAAEVMPSPVVVSALDLSQS